MKSLWREDEASQLNTDRARCAYAARLLGQGPHLVAPSLGGAAVKTSTPNLYGEAEPVIAVTLCDQDLAALTAEDLIALRLPAVKRLLDLDVIGNTRLMNEIAVSRLNADAPIPPTDILLYAALPGAYTLLIQPVALLAIVSAVQGEERLRSIYGDALPVVEYATMGLPLARACNRTLRDRDPREVKGILLRGHGLAVFADSAQAAYEQAIELVSRAEAYLDEHNVLDMDLSIDIGDAVDPPIRADLAEVRKSVSDIAGAPMTMTLRRNVWSLGLVRHANVAVIADHPPLIAQAALIGCVPMLGRDIESYYAAHKHAPRIVLDPDLGVCAMGRTASESARIAACYRHSVEVIIRALALGGYEPLPDKAYTDAEARAMLACAAPRRVFDGEVAMVTGGASGIGKACVAALLERGASVVSLDINPAVETLFDQPGYLGIHCDLTDEAAVLAAFETTAHTFGGLDMIVLNAGIFPQGVRVEALETALWQKVMRINLDHNVVILREAYPLLKHAPGDGRVVLNASKNVLAPGAGAAAYSAAKAAVTQLARVAALEWGKNRIRVNMVHPDAVFDTGIWTEDVLQARAAHYGMTVQQYKTRNVLGVELNSRYVAELVAEMLGPLFGKITGAQIAVDGGSDRII